MKTVQKFVDETGRPVILPPTGKQFEVIATTAAVEFSVADAANVLAFTHRVAVEAAGSEDEQHG